LRNVIVERDDVLLNITGDSVARCCQVAPDVLPARVNQHVAIVRPKSSLLDARFLCYSLVSPAMQAQLMALASAGATRNALTKGMIEALVIEAPPLEEQRAIAETLVRSTTASPTCARPTPRCKPSPPRCSGPASWTSTAFCLRTCRNRNWA
jgi:restriction endonuclease S subunit